MYKTTLAAVVLAAGITLAVHPVAAAGQPQCTPRDAVLKRLSSEFAETPMALGLARNGGIVEVLTSRDGNTLTIIITMPNSVSYMVAAGEYWEGLEPTLKDAGA
jgi:hypothetical protein